MHYRIFISALLLLASSIVVANNKVHSGVITMENAYCRSEQLCFPSTPITVFDGIAGKELGSIQQVERFDLAINLASPQLNQVLSQALIWHQELSYDGNAIGFLRQEKGFIQIGKRQNQEFWLNSNKLKTAGYQAYQWPQFLTHYQGAVYPSQRLNLRSKAAVTAKKLAVLTPESEIKFTGKFQGLWAELEVKLYNKHLCYTDAKLLAEYKGWIKYFDTSNDSLNVELGGSC